MSLVLCDQGSVTVVVCWSVAGVAVDDLVGRAVRVLVGHLGGVNPMVGHEHAFKSIKNEQPW